MEVNPQYTKQQIEQIHKQLSENILLKSQGAYQSLKTLYQGDTKQYQGLLNQSAKSVEGFRSKLEQYEINLNEIINKKGKDSQFTTRGQGYLNAKSEQIKSKVKNIDSVSSGIKETVSKIKPQKLYKLPVSEERTLQNLFRTLFEVLYEEEANKFEWKVFKEKGLKYQDGEDFVFRLVNINFQDMSPQNINRLSLMKGDPELDNLCVNSKYSYDIIDLADWMEYVVVGHQFCQDKKACEKQYEKIRKDIDKRAKGSLEMSEKFWRQASQEIQYFRTKILGLQSQVKGITYGMNMSIRDIDESLGKRRQKIREINAI